MSVAEGGLGFAARTRRGARVAGAVVRYAVVSRFVGDASRRRREARATARGVLADLGVDVTTVGAPPRKGTLVAANHVSYVDVLAFFAAIDACFVAKKEVRDWPLLGSAAESAGAIFVDRGAPFEAATVAKRIADAVARGQNVVLFPEGTTSDGAGVGPFRSALFHEIARRGLPAVAACVRYEDDDPFGAPSPIPFTGDDALVPHALRLTARPKSRATIAFGSPRRETDRKTLATRLREDVVAMLAERAAGGAAS